MFPATFIISTAPLSNPALKIEIGINDPGPRGGESSFVISSTMESVSVRKGHGDLIADR